MSLSHDHHSFRHSETCHCNKYRTSQAAILVRTLSQRRRSRAEGP